MTAILLTFAIGLIGGVLSGLLGIGGGAVMVPLMVFILGIAQHTAQGISMLVIIPTALVALWHFHKDKMVDYRTAGMLAMGAIVGALISANFVQYIPGNDLKKLFGIFIIYTGIRMVAVKAKK
ncbi:sulfite exporter TauE/SafE family protein [Anaeroselena agilis]|uniref:Probable membrane transporter protein n=1 Tax=Anaeroselena agilis TaxID=3063788 RepID=A0ABU3NX49_9FIRM|nr:sulfite exporter TauE/SafE family protein [Selenomonadales bacterium 4137-cl]